MTKIKFIHCSDIHLDSPFVSFGMQLKKAITRRNELRDIIRNIVEIAKNKDVDFIIISGDLYESRYISKSTIIFINELFSRISPIMVFIAPGNHDPYVNNSYYKCFEWADNVMIFNKENCVYNFKQKKVKVYGKGFENYYEEKSLIKDMEKADDDYINVLGVHGTVDFPIGADQYNSMTSQEVKSLNMDYVALGHIHNKIEKAGGIDYAYNIGCPEPLKFGDDENCGVFLVEIEKNNKEDKKIKVDFIKLSKRFYKNIDINIDGVNSDDDIIKLIIAEIEQNTFYKSGIYAVSLKGKRNCHYRIDIKYIEKYFMDDLFYLKVMDKTDIEFDLDRLKLEKGLSGIFVRKVLARIEKAEGEEKEMLKKALDYGLEVIETGKIDIG